MTAPYAASRPTDRLARRLARYRAANPGPGTVAAPLPYRPSASRELARRLADAVDGEVIDGPDGVHVRVERPAVELPVDRDRLDVAGRVQGVVCGDDLERPGAVGGDRARDRVRGGGVDADRELRAAGRRRALEELDLRQVGIGAGGGDREGIRCGCVDDPDRGGDVDRGRIVVHAAILDDGGGRGVAGVVDRDHTEVVEPVGAARGVPGRSLIRPRIRVCR